MTEEKNSGASPIRYLSFLSAFWDALPSLVSPPPAHTFADLTEDELAHIFRAAGPLARTKLWSVSWYYRNLIDAFEEYFSWIDTLPRFDLQIRGIPCQSEPVDGNLYIKGSGELLLIDPQTRKVPRRFDFKGVRGHPVFHNGMLYITHPWNDTMSIIDPEGKETLVETGQGPLPPIPCNGLLYIANRDGTVSVVDQLSKSIVQTIQVGGRPSSIILVNKRLYVATGTNDLPVIDPATNQLIDMIRLEGKALPPISYNGMLYVPSAGSGIHIIDSLNRVIDTKVQLIQKVLAKYLDYQYTIYMILNFASQMAQDIFDGKNSRYSRRLPMSLHGKARRLLDQLNAATAIETLKVPPSNKLSKLTGDLKEFWRIKIDKQWAIVFMWDAGKAFNVDIIDYH